MESNLELYERYFGKDRYEAIQIEYNNLVPLKNIDEGLHKVCFVAYLVGARQAMNTKSAFNKPLTTDTKCGAV